MKFIRNPMISSSRRVLYTVNRKYIRNKVDAFVFDDTPEMYLLQHERLLLVFMKYFQTTVRTVPPLQPIRIILRPNPLIGLTQILEKVAIGKYVIIGLRFDNILTNVSR